MLNTQEREFAKRTGYKNKSGNWIDKQGFIVSESEIKEYLQEVVKIASGQNEHAINNEANNAKS